jgi:TolA-binding protein
MKRRLRVGVFLATAGLASLSLHAQEPAPPVVRKPFFQEEKPIPRALPVPPRATPAPATPIRTATPVPVATPRPAPPATPKPQVAPAARPMKPPEPSDPGEIRISPSAIPKTADELQLDIADSYYAKGQFEMAAPEYERYLGQYPTAGGRMTALFRLGESYRKVGSVNGAKNAYDTLLALYQQGDFIGPAAFRLAELYYQERKFYDALPLYRKASVRLREPAVQNCAKFFAARSLEALGQKIEARTTYEELVGITENNPFQDASRLSLALLLKDGGRLADAIKHIDGLAASTQNPELRAEATVRSGLWLQELRQPEKSEARLKEALALPGIGKWKDVAQIGLVRMLFDAAKYDRVLESYEQLLPQISAEAKPELILLAANANRQLKKYAEASALYEQLIAEFGGSPQAKDAEYDRLVSVYYSDDSTLVPDIDRYLTTNPEAAKRDQVLLMKAEVLFRRQEYASAAPIYEMLDRARSLTPALKAEAIFKLGFCYMQVHDADKAIKAYGSFIEGYPTSKSIAYALGQRAMAYQQKKNFTAALKDYSELIARYPKAKERELALEQKALILGQQGDNAGMSAAFEQLLKDYPESTANSKAHYWVGYVAFEAKKYKKAAEHLAQARELNREEFFERASLRILLAQYYLEDRAAAADEVDIYAKDGKTAVPPEILRWLGEGYFKEEKFEPAIKFFEMLTPRGEAMPDDFLFLARARLQVQKFPEAADALQTYLKSAKDPVPRATGMLDLSRAQIGLKQLDEAQKSVDEALTLQPEGPIAGEARILAGDIQMERGKAEEAAKLYVSVSLVLDDETVTPRALDKAVEAYKKAGKEPEAKKTLNTLQSRYPEYSQRKGQQ